MGKLIIYALGNAISEPNTMGGNTKIFLEFVRRWSEKCKIIIFTYEGGFKTCKNYGLDNANIEFKIIRSGNYKRFGTFIFHVIQTIKTLKLIQQMKDYRNILIYSATDFWPDAIPATVLKLKFKNKIKWVAGFWLFAPNPFSKVSPYKGKNFIRGILFYLYQLPVYYLVNKYADMIFVTSEPDVEKFITKKRNRDSIVVVRGGVDIKLPEQVPEPKEKRYDAVFIGRFHLMKGVLELIDIWKHVTLKKINAKLAMIGNGLLEEEVKEKIKEYSLENNIKLFGFKDGIEKIKIFKSSKIVIHPSIYDSGGMAACEAMICGLPGVSFDLPALEEYYPKGMIKVTCYDLEAFAETIIDLLENKKLYNKTKKDALDWSKEWDWDKRAKEILETIISDR